MSLPLADTRRDPGPASRNFTVRTLGALSASVIALPLMATGAQAAIPTPKPTRALPNALDAAPPYQKGTRCLSSAQPGPVAFAKLLNETYGKHVYGILRTCAAEHGEGRALDWMLNANDSTSLALGNALTRWLAAPDSQGRQGAMARRFGINYIIWNRQMWRAYDPSRGWAPYYGVSPHTDHIHFSFTWDGAYARNSWWTGTAVTNYLTGPLNSAPAGAGGHDRERVPVAQAGGHGCRRGVGAEGDRHHCGWVVRPVDGDSARSVAEEQRGERHQGARQRHVDQDGQSRSRAEPQPPRRPRTRSRSMPGRR